MSTLSKYLIAKCHTFEKTEKQLKTNYIGKLLWLALCVTLLLLYLQHAKKEYIRKTGIGGAKPEYMVVLCARGIRGKRNFRILVVSWNMFTKSNFYNNLCGKYNNIWTRDMNTTWWLTKENKQVIDHISRRQYPESNGSRYSRMDQIKWSMTFLVIDHISRWQYPESNRSRFSRMDQVKFVEESI